MREPPAFTGTQRAFAAYIRDPQRNPAPPDVDPQRMAVYRDLFFNNIEGFLSSGFPVLRSLYDDHDWHRLVRCFFAGHDCQTPYFLQISREFLRYLEHEHCLNETDPPFLLELAHYEWVELALQTAEDPEVAPDLDADGDLLGGVPVLSPLAWPLAYRFAVHRIGPAFRPQRPGAEITYLLVLRDAQDQIHFHEISAATAQLLLRMRETTGATGRELLLAIANSMQHSNPESIVQAGLATLENLRKQGAVLGTIAAKS